MTATLPATRPTIGAWCPVTRGFWTGGRYVTAGDLQPGDVYRWHTYTGFVATHVAPRGRDAVTVHVHHKSRPETYRTGEILELIPQTTGPDGFPLGVHGPGLSAAPCSRACGHPLGEHGPHGCEHYAAGHDNGRRVTFHGCGCPVPWHGGMPALETGWTS